MLSTIKSILCSLIKMAFKLSWFVLKIAFMLFIGLFDFDGINKARAASARRANRYRNYNNAYYAGYCQRRNEEYWR